jgi:hypothetical protein
LIRPSLHQQVISPILYFFFKMSIYSMQRTGIRQQRSRLLRNLINPWLILLESWKRPLKKFLPRFAKQVLLFTPVPKQNTTSSMMIKLCIPGSTQTEDQTQAEVGRLLISPSFATEHKLIIEEWKNEP